MDIDIDERYFVINEFENPNGKETDIFIGFNKLKEFVLKNNLDLSISSLSRHRKSKGFILKEVNNL